MGKKFKVEDFNTINAPKGMVEYVINNVEDFDERYNRALTIMDRNRCSLSAAHYQLYYDISSSMEEWCEEYGYDRDDFDIEEIFG